MTYQVTIQQENKLWTARDKDGTKRAYGHFNASLKGRQLAEYLFHRNEIVDVTENNHNETNQ